jgi:2-polyprenyl-3-methyl-5-hydroxy-6-metoxy-1,4-benzoquinol methylase
MGITVSSIFLLLNWGINLKIFLKTFYARSYMAHFMNPIAPLHFGDHIKPLFAQYPLQKWVANHYIIENSRDLTRQAVVNLLSSKPLTKYCPIFLDTRILDNLVFTVVPFRKDENLNCEHKEITEEELWKSIESTSSQFQAEKPVIIQGKKIYEKALQGQQEMFLACDKMESLILDLLHSIPTKGNLLDLGCGKGANSIPFLQLGWNVDAMYNFGTLIEIYKKRTQQISTMGQLRLSQGDITLEQFEKNRYDLVICYDIFPYIDPKKIQSLMKKIYNALKTHGQLCGTTFIHNEVAGPHQESLEKLGAHFYKGQHITPNLLHHAGFDITLCAFRLEGNLNGCRPPIAIEFIGTKK